MTAPLLGPRSVIVRAPSAVEVTVGGALVVHDPTSDCYARLNPTAAAVWDRLADPTSLADLAAGLVANYGIGADRAARDVEALVAALIGRSMACVVSEQVQTGNVRPVG